MNDKIISDKKILKAQTENSTGLNTRFVNEITGRTIPREQVIEQINKGNPSYSDYHVVTRTDKPDYVRSNPNKSKSNNIE